MEAIANIPGVSKVNIITWKVEKSVEESKYKFPEELYETENHDKEISNLSLKNYKLEKSKEKTKPATKRQRSLSKGTKKVNKNIAKGSKKEEIDK